MMQLQMVSVHSERHGPDVPPTSKGQHQIDFILATKGIAKYVSAAGFCPPSTPWEADHREVFADINGKAFFLVKTSKTVENEKRYFASDNPIKRGMYLEQLTKTMTRNNMFTIFSKLRAKKNSDQ